MVYVNALRNSGDNESCNEIKRLLVQNPARLVTTNAGGGAVPSRPASGGCRNSQLTIDKAKPKPNLNWDSDGKQETADPHPGISNVTSAKEKNPGILFGSEGKSQTGSERVFMRLSSRSSDGGKATEAKGEENKLDRLRLCGNDSLTVTYF